MPQAIFLKTILHTYNLLQCCGIDYTAQNELTAVLLYMMVHVVQVDSWRLAGEGRSPQPR